MLIATQPVIKPRTKPACIYLHLPQWQWTGCQTSLRLPLQTTSRGLTINAPFTSTVKVWRYWRWRTWRRWMDAPRRGSLSLFVISHQPRLNGCSHSAERGNYLEAFQLIFNISTYLEWVPCLHLQKVASRRGRIAAAKRKKLSANGKQYLPLQRKRFK